MCSRFAAVECTPDTKAHGELGGEGPVEKGAEESVREGKERYTVFSTTGRHLVVTAAAAVGTLMK
jgi:hypothetical protein